MDIPKTKGYTCFVKIAESALEGDTSKVRKYIKKFIVMYPESDLIYPFQHLLNGVKNPDGLTQSNCKESRIKICAGCGSFAHGNHGHDILI